MSEIKRLQDLLQRTHTGVCFHGDPIAEILADVDPQQSIWIAEGGTHSIWQIVRHMTAWLNVIRERLTSPALVNLDDAENFPPTPMPIHDNWNAARDEFQAALYALTDAVGKFPESKLGAQVPGRDYTFAVLLHGAVHHNLYHAGQIAMMKSMYRGARAAA